MYYLEATNYKEFLFECFGTDPELIEKWHIESGTNLETCVERTFKDLQNNKVKFYILIDNNNLIGYFGKEENNNSLYLTGFFIKPEFRTKEIVKKFWNCVNTEFMGDTFYCGIYKKNEPAYNFLLKNEGIKVWEQDNSVFIMFKGMR